MDSLSLPEVIQNLDNLINKIAENHQPILVKGAQNDVVYLGSIPGYIDSIRQSIHSSREEWVNAGDLGL